MSYEVRCDICDKRSEWKLRKRWKFFTTTCNSFGCVDKEIDICDNCFRHFVKWMRKQINRRLAPLNTIKREG